MEHTPSTRHAMIRRQNKFLRGIFFDTFAPESAWMRDTAQIELPLAHGPHRLKLTGTFIPHPDAVPANAPCPSLKIFSGHTLLAELSPTQPGPWSLSFDLGAQPIASQRLSLRLELSGVAWTNTLAWLGRVTKGWPGLHPLQPYKSQNANRQLRLCTLEIDDELACDFSDRHSPVSIAYALRHTPLGLNIVGYPTAAFGVGESARCMIRAADAAGLPNAVVPLKLNCLAEQNDTTYAARLQETNPHSVNVVHLDAPGFADIEHHHGAKFFLKKHTVGYWAWELPEFPDSWIRYFDYVNEIWCPSDFVRDAIAAKSPVPVITMPHAISFDRPTAPTTELRAKFNLPADRFLFLFLYDLHSYAERKNARAAIEAFRLSGLADQGASLVIKTHGVAGNETALENLRASLADLPHTYLIAKSLSRAEIYELEAACDCFVSLHRSEGFGLAVAESMFLGKPVISTDWSATAEFLNETNGCPVDAKLIKLERSHGPYSKGQTWADPDVAHAAEWMRKLHADRALGAKLGAAARATMEKKFSPAAIGARYRARLEAIASW